MSFKDDAKASGLSVARLKAIKILEEIAEMKGMPTMFDNKKGFEGRWNEFEDKLTEIISSK